MRGYSTVSISDENQRRILCLRREISAVTRSKFKEERRGNREGSWGKREGLRGIGWCPGRRGRQAGACAPVPEKKKSGTVWGDEYDRWGPPI
jgi:hypothetical protein